MDKYIPLRMRQRLILPIFILLNDDFSINIYLCFILKDWQLQGAVSTSLSSAEVKAYCGPRGEEDKVSGGSPHQYRNYVNESQQTMSVRDLSASPLHHLFSEDLELGIVVKWVPRTTAITNAKTPSLIQSPFIIYYFLKQI